VAALLVAAGTFWPASRMRTLPMSRRSPGSSNVNTGECLTAHAQGAYVGMAPCDGRSAQTWHVWGNDYVEDQGDSNCPQRIPNSSSIDTAPCGWSAYDQSENWLNLFR
jgi:hypothetical protein